MICRTRFTNEAVPPSSYFHVNAVAEKFMPLPTEHPTTEFFNQLGRFKY